MSTPSYTKEAKDAAMKEVTDAGFPPLNCFTTPMMTPQLASIFLKKEVPVISGPYAHVSKLQSEAIFAAISAINSCEYCLTFHAMGMKDNGATEEDIDLVIHGGLPTSKDLKGMVYAAKLANSHKGMFLPREKEYMQKEFGFGPEQLLEIVFLVGQITANNFMMVHLISEGVEVDDMIKPLSPFKSTSYGL
jgi:AhpD family alkylhydroperoxidase